jgi:protein-disulfide isomerase
MKQGWKRAAAIAALAACASTHAIVADAAASKSAKPASAKSTQAAQHQFSGVVTAIDKTSLTVEKSGRAPRTMQFVRDAKMTTQGEVEAQAHVTVYYRDVDGKPTAHRVVVKTPAGQSL